jgi:hypothetical protein
MPAEAGGAKIAERKRQKSGGAINGRDRESPSKKQAK